MYLYVYLLLKPKTKNIYIVLYYCEYKKSLLYEKGLRGCFPLLTTACSDLVG